MDAWTRFARRAGRAPRLASRLAPLLVPLGLLAGPAACSGGRERATASDGAAAAERAALDLGQTYTGWLYRDEHARLWDRFGPEMRRAFGTEDSLRLYLTQTLAGLGAERGTPTERVDREDSTRVYTRVAAFERAPNPMMLQWTLAPSGTITGFFLRPAPRAGAAP
ncbi:MAG TPA: hypothetical protein VFS40_06575 [Gemmatimonadales bacterium]|nr:hypothetical protein [Gemmatimonadales bacterium]